MLTKNQFRLLLVIYLAVSVLVYFWHPPQRIPLSPGELAEAKRRFGMETMTDENFALFMVWLLLTIMVARLIGFVFTFLLWREGLFIFPVAVCAGLVRQYVYYQRLSIAPLGWVTLLLVASIVTLALFGPAKHLFQRKREKRIHQRISP
jgi:hypothetical protein